MKTKNGLVKDSKKNTLTFQEMEISEEYLQKELGEGYRQRTFQVDTHDVDQFIMYVSIQGDKTLIFKMDYQENVTDMSIHDAYFFKHSQGVRSEIEDLTDSDDEYGYVWDVKWEATVTREKSQELDMRYIHVVFTFTEAGTGILGKAYVTVLDQDEEQYSLLEAADAISSEMVYAFNGIPVYEDEFDLEQSLERRKRMGVYGKVAVVENFFIQGAIRNISEVEKRALRGMMEYFSEIQIVDFMVINPTLCDFHEHTLQTGKTEHQKRLAGAQRIREMLKKELRFLGTEEAIDSLLYPIHPVFEENLLPKEEQIKRIHNMYSYKQMGRMGKVWELAMEGHELGITACTFQLAEFCYFGQVVEESREMAFEFFFEAAQDGMPEAMHIVGVMYFEGNGVEQDTLQGRLWVDRAAQKGYDKAVEFLDAMNRARVEFFESLRTE